MTKRGITVVLAIACVLCVIGAALAGTIWIQNAMNDSSTLTTGKAYVMTLENVIASNNTGMYPGDAATISLNVKNDGYKSILKVKLVDSTSEATEYTTYFTIECSIGSSQDGGYVIAANESAQAATLTITMKGDAPASLASKTIKVIITLDPVND
ncbi:MAG: hypothetical protein J1G02_01385 [Clostridiales bacterium]|nr:hypothetical protein [Clostridiales bacterium]